MIEGKTEFLATTQKIPTKKMDAFYNPIMKFNRDLSLAVLSVWERKQLRIALPLAGTGIRGLRLLNELPKNKVSYVYCNDNDKTTYETLQANQELIKEDRFFITNEDAIEFLINRKAQDYIDIDPFGSPNMYLDATIQRISIGGVVAVTATDTAALAGTYPKACKRKYWALPERGNHEYALRILIRKAQLIGIQYDKALLPILSVSKDHYYKIFFLVEKGKAKAEEIFTQHGTKGKFGPMWLGSLYNSLGSEATKKLEQNSFTTLLKEEASSGITDKNYFDIHKVCKKYKLKQLPKMEKILEKLSKKFKVSKSHLSSTGLWTNANEKEIVSVIQVLS